MDPVTEQGLIDLVSLGNTLELSLYLNWCYYVKNKLSQEDLHRFNLECAEWRHTLGAYKQFQDLYCKHHCLKIDNGLHHPNMHIFQPSILFHAVSLYKYKQRMGAFGSNFNLDQLKSSFITHFQEFHPLIVNPFKQDINRPSDELHYIHTFEWPGPSFSVVSVPDTEDIEMAGR